MKVILKQDVKKLGNAGDLLEVNDGYARNFLIPRGLADEATSGRVKQLKEKKASQQARDEKEKQEAEALKKHLQGKQVRLAVSAGDKGKLFGSVTGAQIAQAVSKQFGSEVNKKDLKLDEQVKQVGEYKFRIRLYPGAEAEMTLKVEAE